jgi:ferritin-like metal-binding protein YciE
MEMNAMEDLLLQELTELYGAEQQIVKALPKMAKGAHDNKLRGAFGLHLKQTNNHIDRLKTIFKMLGRDPEAGDCDPISEIIKQGDALIALKGAEPAILDAALITAAQKVEHYEIALYGTARSHARLLGYIKVGEMLAETLREEEETDALLTQLAKKRVNLNAAKAPFSNARVAPRGSDGAEGWGVGALISGLAIGAAVAMLYAPKSGEQLRQGLGEQLQGLKEKAGVH